jgi:hypothetical protein
MFEALQSAHIVRDFAVDAMASDLDEWSTKDFELFAKLLRIAPSQIIPHRQSLLQREAYFQEIKHKGDLFLDPDTGIATGRLTSQCHLDPREVKQLLEANPDRLLAIYQHVRAQKVKKRVDCVLDAVKVQINALRWCSYESGTVAMLFLSLSENRHRQVSAHFSDTLGRHAMGRIRYS